jgi:aspartate racemase
MGPLAGVRLAELVVRLTPAKTDQEHPDVLLISAPGQIADRTDFLLGRSSRNPAAGVAKCITTLAAAGATVIGVACNTVHAPPIWDRVTELLKGQSWSARVLNMIEETCLEVSSVVKPSSRIGVLATSGTVRTNLYGDALAQHGFEAVYLPDSWQEQVHDAIYNVADGIKASVVISDRVQALVREAAAVLVSEGVSCVIMGCTELPLAFSATAILEVPVIDPSVVLARKLLKIAGQKNSKEDFA